MNTKERNQIMKTNIQRFNEAYDEPINTQACTYIAAIYLDYVNNFLTVERFAEHHGLYKHEAETLIKLGRKVANRSHPDA